MRNETLYYNLQKVVLLVAFLIFSSGLLKAQSLTLRPVGTTSDQYTPGSSIAAPFEINITNGCIDQSNVFTLYISASPDAAPTRPIASYSGFYTTFLNGTIPTDLTPGRYYLEVRSSNPVVTSDRTSINIVAGTPVTASIRGEAINTSNPDIFGNCEGKGTAFGFSKTAGDAATVKASFYNEFSQADAGTFIVNPSISFNEPNKANYTVVVTATSSNGMIGTKAYQLINNKVNTTFGTTGGNTVCLTDNGTGALVYTVDYTSVNGIQYNYPGNLYLINWGDGSSSSYTFCEIKNMRGLLPHTYKRSSCGSSSDGSNSFAVKIQSTSPFCGAVGTTLTSSAVVVDVPTNSFNGPNSACVGQTVTFNNTSNPGQDPSSSGTNCINTNAKYKWYIDDQLVDFDVPLSGTFSYTFPANSHGRHKITLELQQNGSVCPADRVDKYICILNNPIPQFSLPVSTICNNGSIAPNNQSYIDDICDINALLQNKYRWNVTGPAGAVYVTGSAADPHPEIKFTTPGIYQISLTITTENCGEFTSAAQNIVVNDAPTVSLSPNIPICGNNQTLTFDNTNNSPTKTTFNGTFAEQTDTYTWTVSGGNYAFQNGTNANSKYPQIIFYDYGIYTVTATNKNNCGTDSKSQQLDFRPSPVVNAGPDQPICPTDIVHLNGTITGTYQSFNWTGGAGTFLNPNSLTSTYTPTNAEIASGRVVLTLHVVTGNPAPCDQIYDDVVITINPENKGVNTATSICTGNTVNFQPQSSVPGSTFTWTATTTNATVNLTSGSGNINDVLTNTDGLTNGTVTYTITPAASNCQGTPFTLTVTVTPRPVVNANNNTICSGQPAGINLTPNISNTKFKWTSTPSPGISGNTNPSEPTSTSVINDALTNNTTTAGTVTYQITPVNTNADNCDGTPITVTVTVQPEPVKANAGNNKEICPATTFTLEGNDPKTSSGKWTLAPGTTGVTFTDDTKYNTTVNGLQPGQQYTFRWTITGAAECTTTSADVTITDLLPLTNNISSNSPVCYGQTINITGDPSGGNGSYGYIWESSSDGINWTRILNQTNKNYSFTGTESIYIHRILTSGPCSDISQSVHIIVQPPIANNSITGNQSMCYNDAPALLTGSTPTGADGIVDNYKYQWQNSTDNGETWFNIPSNFNPNNSNSKDYQPDNLTKTTQFRRVVTSLLCNGPQHNISSPVTITVKPLNTNTITGASSKTICTGTSVNYQLHAQVTTGTSFTWVSSASSNAIQGNSNNSQPGNININDVLVNSDPNHNGTVTYTITPFNNGCPGTPFTLTVTVTPIPSVTITNNGNQICSGNSTGITFTTNTPGVTLKWTSDNVQGIYGNNNQTNPVTATGISDVLTSDLTSPATIVYHITPVSEGGCVGQTVDATVTVLPQPVRASAGTNDQICNASTYTLNGNNPAPSTGKWTFIPAVGQSGITFDNANQYNTIVNGLQPGQNYSFRWTITSTGACSTSSADVTISDLRDLTNNISFNSPVVCYGQTVTALGDQPTGGTGSFVYGWESSTDQITWTTIANQNGKDYSFTGTQNLYIRRIVTSGPCTKISQPIYIIVQPPITNNTVASDQEVCYNYQPKILVGSAPAGGDGNYSYQWQTSTNNGANWTNIVGATASNYQVNNLTVTTQFRRVVTSVLCTGPQQSISNIINIMVNPLPDATFTYTNDVGCIPYKLDTQNIKATPAAGNNTYAWYADGVFIGSGFNFPGFTITEDNKQVVIKLVATSKYGCLDASFTHTFTTIKEVSASFTQNQTKGCGLLTVTFTNSSSPQNAATYTWNFGNGTTSTLVNPNVVTFLPRADGKDTTYTVTLRALTACGIRTFTSGVTVRPQPKSIFTPDKTVGCSPLIVNFNNTSPGTNNTYTFDFGDGTTFVTNDNRGVTHTYTSTTSRTYLVKMTATNECGTSVTQYNIRISPNSVFPQLVVNGDQKAGCAPWTVQFYNNTKGGTYFTYDFGDGTIVNTLTAPEVVNHTFLKEGTYNVKLTATNGCSDTSTYQSVIVYPQPKTSFTADVLNGCTQLTVNFKNQTPGSNSYVWDFGDGGVSASANPTHTFMARTAPYTVTLIAKNGLGCTDTMVMKNYINVSFPPKAAFTPKPDSVIAYPYFNFSFVDKSTNTPILWKWNFGDGLSSNKQNPDHTYRDTGMYKVQLVVYNLQGCADSITHNVQITGVPGQLFVPNAFMPTSRFNEIVTFKAKGSGLKTWRMRVFNKWGQVIWETTKLTPRGEPAEGWDGLMGGAPAPQGVYVWQIEATYINGKEWTGMSYKGSAPSRTGVIHLIR